MTATAHSPIVPVSWGELLDKISILEIKAERLSSPAAVANVGRERAALQAIGAEALRDAGVREVYRLLRDVNEELWEIEDAIRGQEAQSRFGDRFISLARSVYIKNDARAALKRQINELLDSDLFEEKSYAAFAPPATAAAARAAPQPAAAG
jgi:hypothetical protein